MLTSFNFDSNKQSIGGTQGGWNSHTLQSTEGDMTPMQLYLDGLQATECSIIPQE